MIPFYLRLLPFLWLTPALAQQELSPLIQDWNDKTCSVEDRLQTAKDLHELRGLLEHDRLQKVRRLVLPQERRLRARLRLHRSATIAQSAVADSRRLP